MGFLNLSWPWAAAPKKNEHVCVPMEAIKKILSHVDISNIYAPEILPYMKKMNQISFYFSESGRAFNGDPAFYALRPLLNALSYMVDEDKDVIDIPKETLETLYNDRYLIKKAGNFYADLSGISLKNVVFLNLGDKFVQQAKSKETNEIKARDLKLFAMKFTSLMEQEILPQIKPGWIIPQTARLRIGEQRCSF